MRVISAAQFRRQTDQPLLERLLESGGAAFACRAVQQVSDLNEDEVVQGLATLLGEDTSKSDSADAGQHHIHSYIDSFCQAGFNRSRLRIALAQRFSSDEAKQGLLRVLGQLLSRKALLSPSNASESNGQNQPVSLASNDLPLRQF